MTERGNAPCGITGCYITTPHSHGTSSSAPERFVDPERVNLGRNQYDLLTNALEGMLALIVEDWRADVPIVRDPWEGAGVLGRSSGTGDVWAAIDQARAVLGASERWTDGTQ